MEDNEQIVRRLVEECVNTNRPDLLPDHAFPDLQVTLDDVIATNDKVAARWTATGTHRTEFAGIPATCGSVRWGGIDLYRLADHKVAEWWRNDDFVGLLQQLRRDPLAY